MENISCPVCDDESGSVECPICDGEGYRGSMSTKEVCKVCKGSKKLICNGCQGTGTISVPVVE